VQAEEQLHGLILQLPVSPSQGLVQSQSHAQLQFPQLRTQFWVIGLELP
jgi:hypothetical protein